MTSSYAILGYSYFALFLVLGFGIGWRLSLSKIFGLMILALLGLYVEIRLEYRLVYGGITALMTPENWHRLAVPAGLAAASMVLILTRVLSKLCAPLLVRTSDSPDKLSKDKTIIQETKKL